MIVSLKHIMIASPSDVANERNAVEEAVLDWNREHTRQRRVHLTALRWEKDAIPHPGLDAQAGINRDLVENCAMLIAIFRSTPGSPTATEESGTISEINAAEALGIPVAIFFYKGISKAIGAASAKARLDKFKARVGKTTRYFEYASTATLSKTVTAFISKTMDRNASSRSSFALMRSLDDYFSMRQRLWASDFYITELNCRVKHSRHPRNPDLYLREVVKSFYVETSHKYDPGKEYEFKETQALVFPKGSFGTKTKFLIGARVTLGDDTIITKEQFVVDYAEKDDMVQVRVSTSRIIPAPTSRLRVQVSITTISSSSCDYEWYKVSRATHGYHFRFEPATKGYLDYVGFTPDPEAEQLPTRPGRVQRDSTGISYTCGDWMLPGEGAILLSQPS